MKIIIVYGGLYWKETYSVDSVTGEEGMIMTKQLVRMVVIMQSEKSEWVRIPMATRRTGLNGVNSHTAGVALKRKMSFFLLTITNVWKLEMKVIHFSIYKMNLYISSQDNDESNGLENLPCKQSRHSNLINTSNTLLIFIQEGKRESSFISQARREHKEWVERNIMTAQK